MNDTRHNVDTDTFATLVESHRVETRVLEETHWYGGDHAYRFRLDATATQKLVAKYSVGGFTGFVLGLVATAVLCMTLPYDYMPVPFFIGAGIWGAFCFLAHRFTRSAFVPMTDLAKGVEYRLKDASSEFHNAADAGREGGAEALAAFNAMQPGIEELYLEHWSLEGARNAASVYAHQRDYVTSLDAEVGRVATTLADVLAEVQAAAAVLFSQRPDLLLPPVVEPAAPVARITRLSEDGQSSLAQARTNLARVIAG